MTKEEAKAILELFHKNMDEVKLLSPELLQALTIAILSLSEQGMDENVKGINFPQKATHKSFGEITLLGMRIECSSNNNTMYFLKLDGEYVWGYDYEITIPPKTKP